MRRSAYYVGGIAETAVGKSAPWFILAIMLFSYSVRAIYIESCSHVRARRRLQSGPRGHGRHAGQVLRLRPDVRLRAHRPHLRRQRGPVPRRSDQRNQREHLHQPGLHVHPPYFAAVFAAVVTLYFWRKNIMGMHESSEKALRIMQIASGMVVVLIVWCIATILTNGLSAGAVPQPANYPLHRRFRGLARRAPWRPPSP